MIFRLSRNVSRRRRHLRIRKMVAGTKEMPRVSVFRSLKHIYAQCIDDLEGDTIVSASSLEKPVMEAKGTFKERAKEVGKILGARAKEKGIKAVVFDRSGYKYHGRIAALADGLREAGLEF